MIRKKIITQEDIGLVNFDGATFGIGSYLGNDDGFPTKLLTAKEREDRKLYFSDDYSLTLYPQKNGTQLADRYVHLNGNEIACEYLASQHPHLDFTQDRSIEGKLNFVAVKKRNQTQNLDRVFIDEVPRLTCEKLLVEKAKIHRLLVNRFGIELVRPLEYFRIQSIEANLDVMSPVGDDYGRNTLIAVLLSQKVLQSALGYYLNDKGYVAALPKNKLHAKRVYESNLHCGIPCLWMLFDNGLEMVVYLKEITHCKDVTSADHQYLQRFELRFARNFKIQNASDLVRGVLGDNRFSNTGELQKLLHPLYKMFHGLLFDALNVPFSFTDEDCLERIANMIEAACPMYSRWLVRRLMCDGGRVYVAEANERGINDCLKDNSKGPSPLFIKPQENGRYYVLNWKAIPLSVLHQGSTVLKGSRS